MRIVIRSLVVLSVALTTIVCAAPAAASVAVTYEPPVDAPVSDPFRPPATPYGPGNRGIEYATAPGTPVAAAADGEVVFAGYVAAKQWVTVTHADGIRTTYGPLSTVQVANGATVARGEVVGTTAGPLTFTARLDGAYVDPSSLFDAGPPRVRLVPEPLDLPQARALSGNGWDIPGRDALASAIDWELRHVEATPALLLSLTPAPVVGDAVTALADWRRQRDHCTPGSEPAHALATRHRAVLVGGLGSSSVDAAVATVDTSALGYAAGDVTRFSYRGGDIAAQPYSPSDTTEDIRVSGQRLADYLVAMASTTSEPIDVIAHSQGGLVVRVALADLEARAPEVLQRLGVVVTIGTPHRGADLAALVTAVDDLPQGQLTLDAIRGAAGLAVGPDDVAVEQLAPGSSFLRELAARPLPAGVRLLSIAGRGDLVVPAPRARLDGAINVIVPVGGATGHDRLPGAPEVTREIALALAGAPPTCETVVDAVLDATTGGLIGNVEHTLAVTQGG